MTGVIRWFRRPRAESQAPISTALAFVSVADRYAYFRQLPAELRPAFERDVQQSIATQRNTGVKRGVNDELRLLVAASAATLSLAWNGYRWKEVAEVLLYPDNFDPDYRMGHRTSLVRRTRGER